MARGWMCRFRRMNLPAGVGGIGKMITDSTVDCVAQRCGFKNWSLINVLRGLTCCKSWIYGASAEAPEEEQSAANDLLHRWLHSICVLKLRLFCSVSQNAESYTKIWLKIQCVDLVWSGRTWLAGRTWLDQHARLLFQQLKSVIISVGEGNAAWSEPTYFMYDLDKDL